MSNFLAYFKKQTRGRRLELSLIFAVLMLGAWLVLVYAQPSNRVENRGYTAFPDHICPGDSLDGISAETWVNAPSWVHLGEGTVRSWWENAPGEARATSDFQDFPVDYRRLKPGLNSGPSSLLRTAPLTPGDYVMVNKRSYNWYAYGIRRRTTDEFRSGRILTVVDYGAPNPDKEEVGRPICD